ncbi:Rho guanine nucleotide exchange factor [Marasmius crinis-equi]|uniref:Rho guanine nucleotide exchange factor n=1 Tax=Marasmius crinis-equi TaxID=585013 RepID=A0ABR3FG47_9AGAR
MDNPDAQLQQDPGLTSRLEALFQDKANYQSLLSQSGANAQSVLDMLQLLTDCPGTSKETRSAICSTMIRLSKSSGFYPRCLSIENVSQIGDYPVAGGGFGDVFKGRLGKGEGRLVCLKVTRAYQVTDVERVVKEYTREAILWRQLKHQNILPFLGLYYLDENKRRLCLVSPWVENGNLVQYLKNRKHGQVDCIVLAYDVASGLSHLHEKKVVHGDLKGVNILITPDGRACITDFGLSRIVSDTSVLLSMNTNPISHAGGTARWLAPELLLGGQRTSRESDMWAFGCLCYEIFTGLIPFYDTPNDAAVVIQVCVLGNRPQLPSPSAVPETVRSLMQWTWESAPDSRPSASAAVEVLLQAYGGWVEPAKEWDEEVWNVRVGGVTAREMEVVLERLEGLTRGGFDLAMGDEDVDGDGDAWLPSWNLNDPGLQMSSPDPIAPPGLSWLSGLQMQTQMPSPVPPYQDWTNDWYATTTTTTITITRADTWDGGSRTPSISRPQSRNDTWDSYRSPTPSDYSHDYDYSSRTPSLISVSSSTSSTSTSPPSTPSPSPRLNKNALPFIPAKKLTTRRRSGNVSIKRPDGSDVDWEELRMRTARRVPVPLVVVPTKRKVRIEKPGAS